MTDLKDLRRFINKTVMVEIERPMGSMHPTERFVYGVNYGFIPNTISGDGEPVDVYVIGHQYPIEVGKRATCKVIAIIDRQDDYEQKLVAIPIVCFPLYKFTAEQIWELVSFRERNYKSTIYMEQE